MFDSCPDMLRVEDVCKLLLISRNSLYVLLKKCQWDYIPYMRGYIMCLKSCGFLFLVNELHSSSVHWSWLSKPSILFTSWFRDWCNDVSI